MSASVPVPQARALVSIPTLAAMGAVAAVIATLGHEGAGHGLACIALGSHVQQISTVHLSCDESAFTPWAVRGVAAAGTLYNLVLACVFAGLARAFRGASPSWRTFLWVSLSMNGLSGSGYLMTSPLFGFGDWTYFVDGISAALVWRIGLSLAGALLGIAVVRWGARELAEFIGPGEGRMGRAYRLVVPPYLATGILGGLGGALNPHGLFVMALIAHFLGACWFLWMPAWMPKEPAAGEPLALPTSPAWIAAGVIASAVFVLGFGPGVPR